MSQIWEIGYAGYGGYGAAKFSFAAPALSRDSMIFVMPTRLNFRQAILRESAKDNTAARRCACFGKKSKERKRKINEKKHRERDRRFAHTMQRGRKTRPEKFVHDFCAEGVIEARQTKGGMR